MVASTYTFRPPVIPPDGDRAFWLSSIGDELERLPALSGKATADIAIIGGGLTGLWTALRLSENYPELSVTVLEADVCGAGASGRNGGQVHSWFGSLDTLSAVVGTTEAVELAKGSQAAIEEMRSWQESGEADLELRLDGWLWTASSRAQEGAWNRTLALTAEIGVDPYRPLSAEDIEARTGTTSSYVGIEETEAGTLHPGKLVAALRRKLLDRGVRIFESTPVLSLRSEEQQNELSTPGGQLTAKRVLIATNAWAASVPEINRYLYVVEGNVMVTEPIPERLDALGWTGGESICDSQMQVLYFQRTTDGRVLFGRGGGSPVYRDHLGATANRDSKAVPAMWDEFVRLYPSLSDVKIAGDWSGPIDCVAGHVPMIGHLQKSPSVSYCVGWNGTGLAQIPVVARIIASVLADDAGAPRSGLVDQPGRQPVPPEPIRFIGAHLVRAAVVRKNRRELANLSVGPITRALVSLMPHPHPTRFPLG